MTRLARAVAAAQRWLVGIYRLDIEVSASQFLVAPDEARQLLPARSPRSGLVVVEEEDGLSLGLYVDPRDCGDLATIVEGMAGELKCHRDRVRVLFGTAGDVEENYLWSGVRGGFLCRPGGVIASGDHGKAAESERGENEFHSDFPGFKNGRRRAP